MVADSSVCTLLNGALSTCAICFLTSYNSFNRQPPPLIHAGSPQSSKQYFRKPLYPQSVWQGVGRNYGPRSRGNSTVASSIPIKITKKSVRFGAKKATGMNIINVVLTGLTALFAVIAASRTPTWALIATAISAVATVVFVVWQGTFDPAGKENQQRTAAKELLWIREQLLLLVMDCHMSSVPLQQLQKCLEIINRELTAVYKFAPNTSLEAYSPHSGKEIGKPNPTGWSRPRQGNEPQEWPFHFLR